MDFPIRPTEKVQHVCAFCVNAMNLLFTTRLQAILSIKLGVCYNQRKWCVFDFRPIKISAHPWCSPLGTNQGFWQNLDICKSIFSIVAFLTYHSIKMIFLIHNFASCWLIYDRLAQLKVLWRKTHCIQKRQKSTHLKQKCVEVSRLIVVIDQFDFNHINGIVSRLQDVFIKLG